MPTTRPLPSPASPSTASVASALSCTRKGRLAYDRDWLSRSDSIERVLQEVTTDITNLAIHQKSPEGTPKNKKKKSIGAMRNNQLVGNNGQKKNAENRIASPTEVKRKAVNDIVLSPVKVSVNRDEELNIEDPKNIMKAKFYVKDKNEQNCDHPQFLSNSTMSRDKGLSVLIERLKISNLDCNTSFLVSQIEPNPRLDKDTADKHSNYIKDYLTDDDDDVAISTSPVKGTLDADFSTPVARCLLASPTSPEAEELLSYEVRMKQETEQRLQERKKKWDADLEKIREKTRLELEARLQEASQRETLELEKIIREKEEMERRAREKAEEELLEREARQRELEEMVKQAENKKLEDIKRQEQLEANRERLLQVEQGLQNKCNQLKAVLNHPRQAMELSLDAEKATRMIADVEEVVAKLNKRVDQGIVSEEDWSVTRDIGGKLDSFIQEINNKVNVAVREAQKEAEEEKRKQAEAASEEARARVAAEKAAKAAEKAKPAPVPTASLTTPAETVAPTTDLQTENESSMQMFTELQNFKNNYVANIVFADSERAFKFDLQKAVNTPMNAISAQTSAHLKDKLDKLTSLLSGSTVTVGEKQLSASSHPTGVSFCLNLAAKKLVQQGEDVISSKAEAAFPFATVALALWDKFPDFGKLLLAYFYEICPFLVPHHPGRLQGQTDREFYQSRGYKYDADGVVEEHDKYLKRMSGIIRLYAALCVSKLPRDSVTTSHPHGPSLMWTWLSSVMSLGPVADITATALLCVLEVTGSWMFACYGRQFGKLLSIMAKEYVPMLEQVKVEGGPVERLVDFLAIAMKQHAIKDPEGVLKSGFL